MRPVSLFGVARGGGLTFFSVVPAQYGRSIRLPPFLRTRLYLFMSRLCADCLYCIPFSCETFIRAWSSKVRPLYFWAISRTYLNESDGGLGHLLYVIDILDCTVSPV